MIDVKRILVRQDDLSQSKIEHYTIDEANLAPGDIVLKTENVGFSANNITYAALGHGMGYWGFFPAQEGYGVVPVWGFAVIEHSTIEGMSVGDKVYGYLPMASHLVVRPAKLSAYGFSDVHPQRKSISPVYDNYLFCKNDPAYDPQRESWQSNFRPLFMTSFVLDEHISRVLSTDALTEGSDECISLVLSSASSKTAFGTALLLQAHKSQRNKAYKVLGLTSKSNLEWVSDLACYDEVYSYEALAKLPKSNTYLLDFAANGSLIANLQDGLGKHLKKITLIGATDWKAEKKPNKHALSADIFFAPALIKSLHQEWGQAQFLQRYSEAWQHVAKVLEPIMYEKSYCTAEAIVEIYLQTLHGKADTKALNILSFD